MFGMVTTLAAAETRIRMASTTSTQNSGLFDYLLPIFEKKTGIKIDVVAVGTGASIEIGKRGDADVVFVHAKEQELKAVEEGYFVNRHDVMYNDFVIIGPTATCEDHE
jgi:tungstate transport system substrate-binding protein